jgi:outer membrane lipoprotein
MKAIFPLFFLLLAACSSVPESIKKAPVSDWQLAQIKADASSHKGEAVRWGGQVVKVENDDNGSTLHIVQFPLNSFGRPDNKADSQGRFLAHSRDFIDPYIYKSGTLVTVAGTVADITTVTVDQKQLKTPVVDIRDIYRWSPQQYRDPYWYDDPYYYDRFGYGLSYPAWRSNWYYRHGYYW